MLNQMPLKIAGQPRALSTELRDTEFASLQYGDFTMVEAVETGEAEQGKNGPYSDSANSLAAIFGLGLGCLEGSYRGTAPPPALPGTGPGITEKRLTHDVWFSCTIDGAEGDEDLTGYAVGWTSRQTAWLAVGHDRATVQALIVGLLPAVR